MVGLAAPRETDGIRPSRRGRLKVRRWQDDGDRHFQAEKLGGLSIIGTVNSLVPPSPSISGCKGVQVTKLVVATGR